MTTINRAVIVPFTAAQMYAIVNDVQKYPEYVPYCQESEIISKSHDEIRARLHLSRAGIEKSFSTSNRLQKNKMIEITLLDGPFKSLHGYWRFTDLTEENSCKVEFDLQFEFANKWLNTIFGPVFTQMANMLVESFCQRASDMHQIKNKSIQT